MCVPRMPWQVTRQDPASDPQARGICLLEATQSHHGCQPPGHHSPSRKRSQCNLLNKKMPVFHINTWAPPKTKALCAIPSPKLPRTEEGLPSQIHPLKWGIQVRIQFKFPSGFTSELNQQ